MNIFTVNTISISPTGTYINTTLLGVFNSEDDARKVYDREISAELPKWEKSFDPHGWRVVFTNKATTRKPSAKYIIEILVCKK